MEILEQSQDLLKIRIKDPKVSRKKLWLFVVFIVLLGIACLFEFIESNKSVLIECNKTQNICTFKEKEYFSTSIKGYSLPINSLGNAYIHLIGCSGGGCSYKLIISKNNDDLILYQYSHNKAYLDWVVETFNYSKANKEINYFIIPPSNQTYITPLVYIVVLLPCLFVFIRMVGISEEITVDKLSNKLIVKQDVFIGYNIREIRLSFLAQLMLNRYEPEKIYYITYEKCKKSLLWRSYNNEEVKLIYDKLNNFIFNNNPI